MPSPARSRPLAIGSSRQGRHLPPPATQQTYGPLWAAKWGCVSSGFRETLCETLPKTIGGHYMHEMTREERLAAAQLGAALHPERVRGHAMLPQGTPGDVVQIGER